MKCSCCGEDRIKVATLKCSGDVAVCRECIGWLAQQVGVLDVTPTLPVADMGAAVQLCERAGFEVHRYNDGFAFVHWNGQSMFDLDLIEDLDVEANHAGCYISLPDLDGWHARFRAAGLAVTPLEDMPWGMREFKLAGPAGANIRVGWPTDGPGGTAP